MKLPALSTLPDLTKQTLRTVAVLVGACVLFVGATSLAAVALTERAFNPTHTADSDRAEPARASEGGAVDGQKASPKPVKKI